MPHNRCGLSACIVTLAGMTSKGGNDRSTHEPLINNHVVTARTLHDWSGYRPDIKQLDIFIECTLIITKVDDTIW